jgi:SNF2 family DNA or RNA helicase
LRRTKEDVAKFNPRLTLPPCDFENVELEMTQAENELYTSVFKDSCENVKQILRSGMDQNVKTMEILECILRCRQVMIHPQLYYDGVARQHGEPAETWEGPTAKMSRLFEMIESHPDEKSLVFSMFTGEMAYIKSELEARGKTVFVISGAVDQELRERQIRAFRKFQGGCVFLIQIKAGGQGLNLQQATRVYITAPSWNPATELQAIARSHRTGQTKRVVVRKLIYSGTDEVRSIEHSIMGLQGEKSAICAKVLNDERLTNQVPTKTRKNVTIHQLKKIFRLD